MKESSVYRAIFEEGEEKGIAKGIATGKAEGEIAGLRLSLITILEQKFASIPPSLEAKIRESSDPAILQSAIRQVFSLASPEALVL